MSINISVADLQAVLAVRQHGSFRAAAQALFITQPSVSSRVQHAEALLGVPLFHRTTRRVEPTAHGERLCEYAERMLYDLSVLSATFKDESQLRAGKVVVGATPTVAATFASEVICSFSRKHPGIEISLIDNFYGRRLDRLITGEADFAVTPTLEIGPRLVLEEIGREEVVLVAPSGHPLVRRDKVALRDTLQEAVVLVSSQTALSELILRTYAEQALVMPPSVTTEHSLTAVALAKNTQRFTFLPASVLRLLDPHGLGVARVAPNGLYRPICLATARDRMLAPAARALMDEFRRHLKPTKVRRRA